MWFSGRSKRESRPEAGRSHWTRRARTDFEDWFADLLRHTSPEQLDDTIQRLLIAAARMTFNDHERKLRMFDIAQAFGAHFLPVHFYSPVPDTSTLPEATWNNRYDHLLGLDQETALGLLQRLEPFGAELADVPAQCDGDYCWGNPAFNGGDASLLYGMIRLVRPRRIIEIGSGWSTLIGLRGLRMNGAGEYLCIEPHPNPDIQRLARERRITLDQRRVQDVPVAVFEKLGANDILFIDSTHVAQIGSDVAQEMLQIVPRQAPGVLIHLHDIFLPFEVSKDWVVDKKLFWNEQLLLAAFMAYNSEFKAMVSNHFVAFDPILCAAARRAFPHTPVIGGGSFWFSRVASPTPG
jgi:predicted O-methyltransferase YrrM